jgi:hypothetical protein
MSRSAVSSGTRFSDLTDRDAIARLAGVLASFSE